MVDVIRVKSSEQRFNALFMSMSSWWIRRRGMFLHLKNRPPGAFLEHWNLNTARRLLMQYGWHNIDVRDVAIQPGFYHHGQFSADYRKLFGELPSTTQINSLTPGCP